MKNIKICVLFLAIFLIFPSGSFCEMVQLVNVSSKVESEEIENYSAKELLEIQLIKKFIISFVMSSSEKQSKLMTSRYIKTHDNPQGILSSTFDKESYLKIDFRKVYLSGNDNAVAVANLYWTTEGFDGIQTFHFMLAKVSGKWLVDWMVH